MSGKQLVTLLNAVAATGAGSIVAAQDSRATFHAHGTTSSGAGSATIKVEVSNKNNPASGDWITLGTITLTLGTASTGDGFVSNAPWAYVRGNVTAISGTGATVNLIMGV